MSVTPEPRQVYTVSRLNAEVRGVLEGYPAIWVEGEVSKLARPASGHLAAKAAGMDGQGSGGRVPPSAPSQ